MDIICVRKENLKKLGYTDFEDWLKNPNNVYIGRKVAYVKGTYNSIYGNPFSAKKYGRDECIKMYRQYITNNKQLMDEIKKLKGKTLGCWCKPEKCHGDVIMELIC